MPEPGTPAVSIRWHADGATDDVSTYDASWTIIPNLTGSYEGLKQAILATKCKLRIGRLKPKDDDPSRVWHLQHQTWEVSHAKEW